MSFNDRIKAAVIALDRRCRPWAARSKWHGWAYEFLLFGLKQAWACLFGGLMLALLVGSKLLWPEGAALHRYDFLVVAALAIQLTLLALKMEHPDEALVILIFHIVGTVMEVFKTAHGSWIYPEAHLIPTHPPPPVSPTPHPPAFAHRRARAASAPPTPARS